MLTEFELEKRNSLKLHKPLVYSKICRYEDKVKRGESVALITLNYDYICNFSCDHCCSSNLMIRSFEGRKIADETKHLTPEDIKEICRQGDDLGLAQIAISGGEPLIYPDLDDVVKAINPEKWWIAIDTNGWFLTKEKAKHLKSIGIDKIQISLDSFDSETHDNFRHKKGAFVQVLKATDYIKDAELSLLILTTVSKQRLKSDEFIMFLDFCKANKLPVYITLAKPIGNWAGNLDVVCGDEEIKYLKELEKEYKFTTRFSEGYGIDLGCIAMKRGITITKYGDVFPCPYIQVSMGNIFEESLKDIIDRGLSIKYFSYKNKYTCLSGNKDFEFVQNYMPKIWDSKDTISYDKVFSKDDYIND